MRWRTWVASGVAGSEISAEVRASSGMAGRLAATDHRCSAALTTDRATSASGRRWSLAWRRSRSNA
jgi:hypothetical protein